MEKTTAKNILDNLEGLDPREGGENPTVDEYVDSTRGIIADWIKDATRYAYEKALERWNVRR